LADLVSSSSKHNEANRDGTDDNRWWNRGDARPSPAVMRIAGPDCILGQALALADLGVRASLGR
jgi:hypothetical protein